MKTMSPIEFKGVPLRMNNRRYHDRSFGGYYHSHQAAELLYVHQGKGHVIVDRRTYELQPGTLFVFQPFQLHRVHADVSPDTPYERTTIHYIPSLMEGFLKPFPALHQFYTHIWRDKLYEYAYSIASQQPYLESLCDYYAQRLGPEIGTEGEEQAALLFVQLLQLLRSVIAEQGEHRAEAMPPRQQRYSEAIMQWVEEHYSEEFRLEELSEALHLSKFYVSRIFRLETGGSISDYLNARRLKEACWLLHSTSLSVERIGMEVGMRNTPYFCQWFRKATGVSPRRYRINRSSV